MISLDTLFGMIWRVSLCIGVFFLAASSTTVVTSLWANVISSESTQNYLIGPKFLVIGESKLHIIVADTDEERAKGLSGRQKLKNDQGMFFIFDKNDFHGIWMKEMLFPIDIIWLDNKFQVVDFIENITPETYPNVYKPKKEARYVLETNNGFIKSAGIKISDQATLLD